MPVDLPVPQHPKLNITQAKRGSVALKGLFKREEGNNETHLAQQSPDGYDYKASQQGCINNVWGGETIPLSCWQVMQGAPEM